MALTIPQVLRQFKSNAAAALARTEADRQFPCRPQAYEAQEAAQGFPAFALRVASGTPSSVGGVAQELLKALDREVTPEVRKNIIVDALRDFLEEVAIKVGGMYEKAYLVPGKWRQ